MSPMKLCVVFVTAATVGCSHPRSAPDEHPARPSSSETAIRITGSDTMVNLVQAWAERYRKVQAEVAVEVAGGGSGVGIAALVDRLSDVAAASREMTVDERERIARNGHAVVEFSVALDALAVYVHRSNPLDSIAIEDLAEIYGEGGRIQKWSQLSITNAACPRNTIIRVGRQNSSGTYAYFREVVLGHSRDYELGSIDQSGSKDVVALVSNTPCAIGYSGMAYATPGVRPLRISTMRGAPGVLPTPDSVGDGTYPLARRLYFYTAGPPAGRTKALLDWIVGPDGQQIVRDLGFIPVHDPGDRRDDDD